MSEPRLEADAQAYRDAVAAIEAIYQLAPALLALARRLPPVDAELIHRVIEALPITAPSQ